MPASKEPIITTLAPADIALTISPENLMPPSAINGILDSFNPFEHSIIADNCGTPTPAIILVVQILPGPIPTFTTSSPFNIYS